jgi:hypothetical protein
VCCVLCRMGLGVACVLCAVQNGTELGGDFFCSGIRDVSASS